jgi:hypothetical protein
MIRCTSAVLPTTTAAGAPTLQLHVPRLTTILWARPVPAAIQYLSRVKPTANRTWAATAPVREIGLRSSGRGIRAFRDAIVPN